MEFILTRILHMDPEKTAQIASRVFITALVVIAIVSLVLTVNEETLMQFSSFTFALGKVTLALVLLHGVDRYVLHGIDLVSELKKQNIAVAITWLGYVALVCMCLALS